MQQAIPCTSRHLKSKIQPIEHYGIAIEKKRFFKRRSRKKCRLVQRASLRDLQDMCRQFRVQSLDGANRSLNQSTLCPALYIENAPLGRDGRCPALFHGGVFPPTGKFLFPMYRQFLMARKFPESPSHTRKVRMIVIVPRDSSAPHTVGNRVSKSCLTVRNCIPHRYRRNRAVR